MSILTEAELLNLIDADIYANAPNQEITADVLNPLLKKIVQSMRNKSKPPFDLKKITLNNSDLDGDNSYVLEHYLKCLEPEIVVYSDTLGKIDRDYFDIIPIDGDATRITYNEAITDHDPHNVYVIKLTDAGDVYLDNVVLNGDFENGTGNTPTSWFWGIDNGTWSNGRVTLDVSGDNGVSQIIQNTMDIVLATGDSLKIRFDVYAEKADGESTLNIGNDTIDITDIANTPGTKTIYHTLQQDPSISGNQSLIFFQAMNGINNLTIDNVNVYKS